MGKLEKYSSYKDSGVDWLGEIPEHWKVKKLKYISIITMGQSPENNHVNQNKIGVPFLQGNAEFGNINPTEKNWCVHPKKIALKNDILYSVRAPVGAVNIADKEYCIGRGLCSIRDMKIQKSFLYYSSILFKQEFDRFSTGSTFEAISTFNIKNLKISIPPKEEQIKIASFLDEKTSQIDKAINQKEKLIELLKERRQITINDAVTKGLDKDVEFVDSGVEWLGEIPEHWEVKKIKHLFNIGRGRVISQQELEENGLFPVYSSQTKNNGVLGYIKTYDYDCKQITWTTDGANAGTVFLRQGKHNCTNVCGTLQHRNKNEILEFVNYSLQISAQFYKRPDTNGAKIMNNEMAGIPITYPPKEEQIKIVEYIENQTSKIDIAIELQQNYISKLKEYKESLIDSVVTGKVRVCDE